MLDYDKFKEVYGNCIKNRHLIAIRFKRPIISYRTMTSFCDKTPIELPDDSIIVVRGPCPTIYSKNQSILLFTVRNEHNNSINVMDESTNTLLRALFPSNRIIYSYFANSTLYIVATENPYSKIMKKCRKDVAFISMLTFVEVKRNFRFLTLEEVASL